MKPTIVFAKLADHIINKDPHPVDVDGALVAVELPINWGIMGDASTIGALLEAATQWRQNPNDVSEARLHIAIDQLIEEQQ